MHLWEEGKTPHPCSPDISMQYRLKEGSTKSREAGDRRLELFLTWSPTHQEDTSSWPSRKTSLEMAMLGDTSWFPQTCNKASWVQAVILSLLLAALFK